MLKSGGVGFMSQTWISGPKLPMLELPPGIGQLPVAGYIRKFSDCESVELNVTVVEPDVPEDVETV